MDCKLRIYIQIFLLFDYQISLSYTQSTTSAPTILNTFAGSDTDWTEIYTNSTFLSSTTSNYEDVTTSGGRNHKSIIVVNNTTTVWPVHHAAVVEGDVILGGLMMVHSREDSITCGPIMPQGGIQALEAMLYTLDEINKLQLLPNITLGAHILDDCDKDTYGLEMAVDFIKGRWFSFLCLL